MIQVTCLVYYQAPAKHSIKESYFGINTILTVFHSHAVSAWLKTCITEHGNQFPYKNVKFLTTK